jgi:hypothetical protein
MMMTLRGISMLGVKKFLIGHATKLHLVRSREQAFRGKWPPNIDD